MIYSLQILQKMNRIQMKICKQCFSMIKEEDLKNHTQMHKKNQIIMLKKNGQRLQNMQRIFELKKELDLTRIEHIKEKFMKEKIERIYLGEYIRKLGGYIRNMINYSLRVFYTLFQMLIGVSSNSQ